jgi:hypothetical protein
VARVHIIPGFAEGKYQINIFRTVFGAAGYEFTDNPLEAKIIIAHSGGVFLIPEGHQAELLILSGIPYFSGTSLWTRLRRQLQFDLRLLFTNTRSVYKLFALDIYYFLRHPRLWLRMYRAIQAQKLPHAPKVTVVYHDEDPYSTGEVMRDLTRAKGWQLVIKSGGHDDLWLHPEVYLKILQQR